MELSWLLGVGVLPLITSVKKKKRHNKKMATESETDEDGTRLEHGERIYTALHQQKGLLR